MLSYEVLFDLSISMTLINKNDVLEIIDDVFWMILENEWEDSVSYRRLCIIKESVNRLRENINGEHIDTTELSLQDMLTVRLLLNKYVLEPPKYISPKDILPWEIGLLQVRLIDKQK